MNIVFDLDGTLIDSAPDIQAVAAMILEGLGEAELTLEETRSFIGQGAGVFVSKMMAARELEETPQRHAQLLEAFVAQYEVAVDRATYYPGVVATLKTLKSAGHRLGLCTNKPELPARAVMRHMGMELLFDAVIAGGMLPSRKPEPAMLHKVVADLGGAPVLYVGDSEIDVETAKRAEIPFALYTKGYRQTPVSEMHCNWSFEGYEQLPGIVVEAASQA